MVDDEPRSPFDMPELEPVERGLDLSPPEDPVPEDPAPEDRTEDDAAPPFDAPPVGPITHER